MRTRPLACLVAFALALAAGPAFALTGAGPSAGDIMAQAKSEAAAQHKNILVTFSASWCGPCHLFEKFLDDPQTGPIMNKAFVIVRLDVGERPGDARHADTPGAEAYRTTLAGPDPGFPYIAMLDASGKPIVDSLRPDHGKKENVGYPAIPVEVAWFMEMLHKAAPSLTPAETASVQTWLQAREMK